MSEIERGEDVAVQNCQDGLNEPEWPADPRPFVEAQDAKVKASHDQNRDLRHRTTTH